MRHILAIFKKQLKETKKNSAVLLQFLLFPLLTLVMTRSVHIEGLGDNYFVNIFAAMFLGMAPLTSISSILAEEKEKNTLRVLMMSNVKPFEYLMGVGAYVFLCCLAGACVITLAGRFTASERWLFLGLMAMGILASLLVGAAIGCLSKNQMGASSITVPVMMLLSFLPMLSMFNETIEKLGKYLYTVRIQELMLDLHGPIGPGLLVIVLNMAVALGLFTLAYRKSGLA